MKKYEIGKQFDFCYGHRVHNQVLNVEYSLDCKCACRHQHGHQGEVWVYLSSDKLNDQDMVTDFKHLSWFKKYLDDTLDHKMILDVKDPALLHFYPNIFDRNALNEYEYEGKVYWTVNMECDTIKVHTESIKEIYEGLILVPFVPTSENLSKWLFEITKSKMAKIGANVSRVQFFETPKSQANYYE